MMRSLSTSAFGQPSETRPTRGAGLTVSRRAAARRAPGRRVFRTATGDMRPAFSARRKPKQMPVPIATGQARSGAVGGRTALWHGLVLH